MELTKIKEKLRIIGNTKDIENIEEILSFGDLGKKINEVFSDIQKLKDNSGTDLASQQIVGFKHGKWNRDDIVGLISSMGLKEKEWIILKEKYPIESDLEESEIKEVNDYFIALANER